MTAQISDRVRYRQEEYVLAGINGGSGGSPFVPEQYGLDPQGTSTANYRGFYCEYALRDGSLLLETLYIGLCGAQAEKALTGTGPLLFGVRPVLDPTDEEWIARASNHFMYSFVGSAPPPALSFSGRLLLGADFIDALYVHMGFHPAWKYRRVVELDFDRGRLVKEHDRCAEAAAFRARLLAKELHPRRRQDVERWIEHSFIQEYSAEQPFRTWTQSLGPPSGGTVRVPQGRRAFVTWRGPEVTAAEIRALRQLDTSFAQRPVAAVALELRRCAEVDLGIVYGWKADELVERAQALGLRVEFRPTQADS